MSQGKLMQRDKEDEKQSVVQKQKDFVYRVISEKQNYNRTNHKDRRCMTTPFSKKYNKITSKY